LEATSNISFVAQSRFGFDINYELTIGGGGIALPTCIVA
jgi:hypothetical protein